MRFLCNSHCAISTFTSISNNHPFQLTLFSYADLESSTNGFSPSVLLGKGSHGAVYRAVLKGTPSLTVAVKKPTASVAQTAQNEFEILSKIRNPRIVNLIGYAVDSTSTTTAAATPILVLVVEHMPNGSLYDLLHKRPDPPGLTSRVRVALQVAKAVRTLHKCNPPVMHRDIKSSNVLMDERGNARLSDFGLAIKGRLEDVRVMSTPPAGTLGYLDPCYLAPGDLSTKSDVFSFGILLLEILSGRKAIDVEYSPPSILEWVLPLIKSGAYQGVLDGRIRGRIDQTVVRELALLAARCVRSTAEKRPGVVEIVDCLKKVYRRVKLGRHVWNSITQRVKSKERSQALDELDGYDLEGMATRRHGSRKSLSDRNRKVSDVMQEENENDSPAEMITRGVHLKGRTIMRSKSTGSYREISKKVGPEGAVTVVKISAVRLGKSRSMSVIYGGKIEIERNNNNNNNNNNTVKNAKMKELEVVPLLVTNSNCKDTSSKTKAPTATML